MRRFTSLLLCLPIAATLLFSASALAEEAVPETRAPRQNTRRVEVVFVLDTTGSMAGLIDGAKKKIWSIANSIIDRHPGAEIRMGLVGYRDLGDEYVTRHYPLTTDIQAIYGRLLSFVADGGGDTPESVNEALDVALSKMDWGSGKADRVIFLVGDAPPHMDYAQDRKYHEIIPEAVQRGIIVNAVQAGNIRSTAKVWREIAGLGKGEYLAIPQDGGRVIIIATPYDEEIIIIQQRLNSTVIPYGSVATQRETDKKLRMNQEAPAPAAADMAAYVYKAGRAQKAGSAKVITGGGDLVADLQQGNKTLEDIPEAELPPSIQGLPRSER